MQVGRAIVTLVQGATRDKAATAGGVNVATLYGWQNNPEFQEEGTKPASRE